MSQKKICLSTIGTRGEIQPLLALALELRTLGITPVLCVPPTFKDWIESFGLECVPVGPDLKQFVATQSGAKRRKPSIDVMRQMVRASVIDQFQATAVAAKDCDLLFTAGDLQHAGKSIAEARKIPHVHATYCPVTLRSNKHTPPNLFSFVRSQSVPGWVKRILWRVSDKRWNALYRDVLNEQRMALGLSAIGNVPRHIADERSWVAADPVLAPAADYDGHSLFQSGAWLLNDTRPLPPELEEFLSQGAPPVYFGFGSMAVKEPTARILIEAARALGHRAVVSHGWGNLSVIDAAKDCLSIDDVNHSLLFSRVLAVVHHGGAGTTTAAARAGTPQVIVPHLYDQFYWGHRVERLKIGVRAENPAKLSVESMSQAIRTATKPAIAEHARSIAAKIQTSGAKAAAEKLASLAVDRNSTARPSA